MRDHFERKLENCDFSNGAIIFYYTAKSGHVHDETAYTNAHHDYNMYIVPTPTKQTRTTTSSTVTLSINMT